MARQPASEIENLKRWVAKDKNGDRCQWSIQYLAKRGYSTPHWIDNPVDRLVAMVSVDHDSRLAEPMRKMKQTWRQEKRTEKLGAVKIIHLVLDETHYKHLTSLAKARKVFKNRMIYALIREGLDYERMAEGRLEEKYRKQLDMQRQEIAKLKSSRLASSGQFPIRGMAIQADRHLAEEMETLQSNALDWLHELCGHIVVLEDMGIEMQLTPEQTQRADRKMEDHLQANPQLKLNKAQAAAMDGTLHGVDTAQSQSHEDGAGTPNTDFAKQHAGAWPTNNASGTVDELFDFALLPLVTSLETLLDTNPDLASNLRAISPGGEIDMQLFRSCVQSVRAKNRIPKSQQELSNFQREEVLGRYREKIKLR